MDKKTNIDNIKKAAALKFNHKKDEAPRITAVGRGIIADKILESAKKNNIAIYKDKDLVERLVKLDIGTEIPPELYRAVAEILAFIYSLDTNNSLKSDADD